jgi:hypothetical protein
MRQPDAAVDLLGSILEIAPGAMFDPALPASYPSGVLWLP